VALEFYSTNNPALRASLEEVVTKGLAPDGGLYLPVSLPTLSPEFFAALPSMDFSEIAYAVSAEFFKDELPELRQLVESAFNFPLEVRELDESCSILELFHGPTAAFKDFGARFMARVLGHFASKRNHEITVLVATSGDTGGAVAAGFYDVPGIKVVILFPKGRVSPLQERQLTSWGKNISTLEVDGAFDDCQDLVKQAFLDSELNSVITLTSANSINFARLFPQSFYYFFAHAQLGSPKAGLIYSVPSGNFGNLCGGVIAHQLGLPVKRFIAATNQNDTFPRFLQSGRFEPMQSIATISNAMDVGNPSNFPRIQQLVGDNFDLFSGYSIGEQETKKIIEKVYRTYGYILDPHAAVGVQALDVYRGESGDRSKAVVLGTAHPAKFSETVEAVLGKPVALPKSLEKLNSGSSTAIGNDYQELRAYLVSA